MKKKKLIEALGGVNEDYVAEANPKIRPIIRKRSIVAACILGAILLLNLWMFLPIQTNTSAIRGYSESEYFPLIQKMYAFTNKPRYKNNFAALVDGLSSIGNLKGEAMENSPTGTGANGEYTETTDNQVSGIIEWDVIKRSDRFIFHLTGSGLAVYEINGIDTEAVARFQIDQFFNNGTESYGGDAKMYLSADCNTVTLILPIWSKKYGMSTQTAVVSLDVSDVQNIKVSKKISFSGEYRDSRMVDGRLILFLRNYFSPKAEDFRNEAAFVPQIDTGDGFKSMPFEKIVLPEHAMAKSCLSIYDIEEKTLNINDMLGVYSGIGSIYVSHEGIILASTYTDETRNTGIEKETESMSEIFAVSFKNGFEYCGSTSLRGYVKDQYSFDIKNGILRIVTTTRTTRSIFGEEQFERNEAASRIRKTSASLYCVLLENMKTISEVENFAPTGEVVRSVRFDGDKAYVCTSFETVMLDPVFIFDISDTGNITSKDTGVIPGFSDSLINFGDYLLGVGYNDIRETKLEVYKEGDTAVESVCVYEPEMTAPYLEYKSFLIDRENGLFGFAYHEYGHSNQQFYVLLGFDGNTFTEIAKVPIYSTNKIRALIIDDHLYVFQHSEDVMIQKLS
jgi:uncharacterized secreted protein with C-terminal beta-propeller domain